MSRETAQVVACPDCGALWPASMRNCPADGALLGAFRSSPPDHDDDAPLAAGTQVGEYRIEDLLGAGGMGEVYRARHPVIDKRVAIKIMSRACSANPINVERFVQEAKAVNAIGHANIVDIFSFGRHDGRCFFVMEWLRGESLRQRLDKTVLAPPRLYEILDAVLRALEAAHAAGVIHRDLKPDNIFLTAPREDDQERVKLLDFGIAKLNDQRDGTRQRGSKTQTGTVVGTPAYMSPEQAGGGVIECASDIYSLGVVAYEMAAGRVPFDAESTVQIMAAHVCEAPPPPSTYRDIDADFEELVLAMLHKQPESRPSPAEVRRVLGRLRGRPTTAPTIHDTGDLAVVPSSKRPTPRSDAHAATALAPVTPLPGSLRLSGQLTVPAHETPDRALVSASIPVVRPATPKLQINFEPPPVLAGSGVVAPPRKPVMLIATVAAVALAGIVWLATRGSDEDSPVEPAGPIAASPAARLERSPAGTLMIEVRPVDAVVAIDGTNQVLENGKLDRRIGPGRYAITVARDGYRTATTTLEVATNEPTRWSTALEPDPVAAQATTNAASTSSVASSKSSSGVASSKSSSSVASSKSTGARAPMSKPTVGTKVGTSKSAASSSTTPTPPSPPKPDVDAVRDPFATGSK